MTISDKLSLLEQTKEAQRVKLGLPKNLPFSQYIKFIRDPFTFSELYKNGEQGIWLDPSDLSTMFQDVQGSIPVTKDGDPVGLMLDKSQQANNNKDYAPIFNSDSVRVRNDSVNCEILDGSTIRITSKAYEAPQWASLEILPTEVLAQGRYEVSFDVVDYSLKSTAFLSLEAGVDYIGLSKMGRHRLALDKKYQNSLLIGFAGRGDPNGLDSITISNLSIKKYNGNHTTQPTSSARAVYRADGNLHWLGFDGVDDTLSVQMPTGTYTEVKASRDGVTHKYPVNVNGSYTLGDLTQTKQSVSGLVLVNRQLTQAEIENVTNLMKVKAGLPL